MDIVYKHNKMVSLCMVNFFFYKDCLMIFSKHFIFIICLAFIEYVPFLAFLISIQ